MRKELDDLDLNLLRLLCAVVDTRNTHAAAEKLGISQTSVSRGMAKLRESFGDRLFIRKAHGVEPSELAERLAEAAGNMLNPIVKVLESYQDFDPEEFDGIIRVAVHLYVLEAHGPDLFDALRIAFPRAQIELVYWQENTTVEVLSGNIDFIVHFELFPLPQEIFRFNLLVYSTCIVARKNHPILSRTSAWESIGDLPLARMISDGVVTKREEMDEIYESRGYRARVGLRTHSVRAMLRKVITSDAITYGTTYLKALSDEIACYPLPPGMPGSVSQYRLCGGYLQTKRDYPLTQAIHQTIQSYFDNLVEQPLDRLDNHPGQHGKR